MASHIKKCPDCGHNNPPASISCNSCNFDIKAVFPEPLAEKPSALRFRRCQVCGEKNDELARACIKCGNEELHRSAVESSETTAAPRPTTIIMKEHPQVIVLTEASRKVTLKILPEGGLIGRSGTIGANELEDYDTISRHHLKVTFMGGNLVVEDLGSANGTKINGRKIVPGTPENLSVGDMLSLADLNFTVSSGG